VTLTVFKWAWSGSRDSFLHFGAQAISLERMKLNILNLVCRLSVEYCITHVNVLQHGGAFKVTDLLKFWEISANISETMQERYNVTMEG